MALPPIIRKLGIAIRDLLTPQSTPQKTGVRSPLMRGVSPRLSKWTPETIASALASADQNMDIIRYLDLAIDLESVLDLHYRAVLSTRKLAVTGMEIIVEAADDTQESVNDADLAREVLKNPAIRLGLKDVQDALGKGFSVNEIIWETSESDWRPVGLTYCDPRWYVFDDTDRQTLFLRETYTQKVKLKPYGYVIHTPSIISALPIRRGFAYPSAWASIIKNFTLQDWARFSEVYGMPLRVGKYPGGTDKEEINILLEALKNLGSDAAAAIPDTMVIEFIERSGGEKVIFEGLAKWVDEQIAIGILGQYGTVQSTSGQLGNATDKQKVRDDIRDDDAMDLAATLRRDIVKPLIDLNFGERKVYPYLRFLPKEDKDPKVIAEYLSKLVPLGLDIEKSWARDIIGAPDPEPGADLLIVPAQSSSGVPPLTQSPQSGSGVPPLNQSRHARFEADNSTVDAQIERLNQGANPGVFVAHLHALVNESESLTDLQAKLKTAYPGMDANAFADVMAQAMTAAHLAGRYELTRNL